MFLLSFEIKEMEKNQDGKFWGKVWTSCTPVTNGAGGVLYYWACYDYYVLWINTGEHCDTYTSCNGNEGVGLISQY